MDTTLLTITVVSIAVTISMSLVAWRVTHDEAERAAVRVATLSAAAGNVNTTSKPDPVRDLRAGAVAAVVLSVSILVVGAVVATGRETHAVAAVATPLELVSLQHEWESGRLWVSGRVRQPAKGLPLAGVSAVVYVLDAQGTQISSAIAPLARATPGSEDETSFEVRFDAPQQVARYRVSFQTREGPTAHVDRRASSPLASKDANSAPINTR